MSPSQASADAVVMCGWDLVRNPAEGWACGATDPPRLPRTFLMLWATPRRSTS